MVPEQWPGAEGVKMQLVKLKLIGVDEPRYAKWRTVGYRKEYTSVPYSTLEPKRQEKLWYVFREYVLKVTGG